MNLNDWGFTEFFSAPLEHGEIYARVIEEQKSQYRLATEDGELAGQLPGRLLRADVDRLERPIVGDWVVARPLPQEKKAVIERVLPRRSLLKRRAAGEKEAVQPLAANVDLAFIVTSWNREFNEKRLQRYLTVAQDSGSRAAVLLTKTDLAPESVQAAAELAGKYQIPCLAISPINGVGIDEVAALLLPRQTAVFVGSSGVGKSTLVNALLGRGELETGAIRESDDRGRHTTTSRRLVPLRSGALVIDTPGLREIQLDVDQRESLSLGFAKIEEFAGSCRFGDCAHETEPGCAVKAALERNEISLEDLASYQKLQREMRFAESKDNKALAADEKRKWKNISKAQRAKRKLDDR